MNFKPLLFLCLYISFSCNNTATSGGNKLKTNENYNVKLPDKNPFATIGNIPVPEGYTRLPAVSNSFAAWLRNIPLKKSNTVYLYDSSIRYDQSSQFAVLDISVPHNNLQQCADAVMRLRAEYLFENKNYNAIHFTDNVNTNYAFHAPYTKENLMHYLETVFGMCGTASLSKQLKKTDAFSTIMPGDVIIRGGFPGHAVIVVDVAQNAAGKKIFMLAQGMMPAQDVHVVKNPVDTKLSPWYEVNDNTQLVTPNYVFNVSELMCW